MKTVDARTAPSSKNPHGIHAARLYDTEHAQVVYLNLQPGEQLKLHITPVDAIFYVLEGEGVIEIGDEKKTVVADTLIDSPADIAHCWYNESDALLRILVVKVPRPTTKTTLL